MRDERREERRGEERGGEKEIVYNTNQCDRRRGRTAPSYFTLTKLLTRLLTKLFIVSLCCTVVS